MSKSFINNFFYNGFLPYPDVKILLYGYSYVPTWFFPNQKSPFWYLWRNRTGISYVYSDDVCYKMDPDHYLLVPPFTPFSADSRRQGITQLFIHFMSGELFQNIGHRPILIPAKQSEEYSTEDFFRILEQRLPDRRSLHLFLSSVICSVLSSVVVNCPQEDKKRNMNPLSLQFMTHISRNLRLRSVYRDFCRSNGISDATMLRIFKQDTGMTPQQYLIECRITQAKNLLLNTALSLDEIAEQTGFSDRYHFSKMFRKYADAAPAAFRKGQPPVEETEQK